MDAIEIRLDGGVFSADVVVRTTHRYTGDYYVDVASDEGGFVVQLTPMSASTDTSLVLQQFRNDALDEQLRERVRSETRALQDTLVEAALLGAGAGPSSGAP